jgi:predicted RNase H-like nuclease (RuvC/YqgF family)
LIYVLSLSVDQFGLLEARNRRLEKKIDQQQESITFLRNRLRTLTSKKAPTKIAIAGQDTPLSIVSIDSFASNQKLDKRKIWSEEEIVNCLMLKKISTQAYDFIRNNQVVLYLNS